MGGYCLPAYNREVGIYSFAVLSKTTFIVYCLLFLIVYIAFIKLQVIKNQKASDEERKKHKIDFDLR